MRLEFTKATKLLAWERCKGRCEGDLCGHAKLQVGKYEYDHIVAANLGGDNSLDNCAVLCLACHGEKTTKLDTPTAAKVKRIHAKHVGATSRKGSLSHPFLRKKLNGEVVRKDSR